MKIRYLGHSCFEITSKTGKKWITDPYTGVGYELPTGLNADVVTLSHGHFDHNYVQAVSTKVVVNEVGEYAVGGFQVQGISSYHDEKQGTLRGNNIIFKMILDGLTLCHMGDIGELCNEELAKRIGKVDVLLIPVGGTYTVDGAGAMEYVCRLQPKLVIPMHYKPADGSLDIAGIEPFLSRCKKEEIFCAAEGVAEINDSTQGVLYMRRVK